MGKKRRKSKKKKKHKMPNSSNIFIFENPLSSTQQKLLLEQMAEKYDEICQQIDSYIKQTVELVKKIHPLKLLQRAYGEEVVITMGKKSEAEYDREDIVARRMSDYIQCIIVAAKPAEKYVELTDEIWNKLNRQIKDLYESLYFYFFCATAKRKQNGNFDEEYDEFYTKAQMYWCSVRGDRHINFLKQHFNALLSPHDEVFNELFGIGTAKFVEGIENIKGALTKGLFESGLELKELHKNFFTKLDKEDNGNIPEGMELGEYFQEKLFEYGMDEHMESAASKFFGSNLFNLEKVTEIPIKLLRELSWAPGECPDFLIEGKYKGWPLNFWPTWNRPFLFVDGGFYCFDLSTLSDHLYRAIQKMLFRLKPEYKDTWNKRQKAFSEQLPFDLFKKILPRAEVYKSIYYRCKTGREKRLNWSECDGLIIFDDHLFIVEVKAGAFTYTPPATDFPAYIRSIKNLLLKPAIQGQRFKDYLNNAGVVGIYDVDHKKIAELSKQNFRIITICCVTLDHLTELAAQSENIKSLGGGMQGENILTISIDDLRVYSDIFTNPLHFLHFVEQRNFAFSASIINAEDELDHLGLYLKHNCYVQYARDIASGGGVDRLEWFGYKQEIDEYYSAVLSGEEPKKPEQDMPEIFKSILTFLAMGKTQNPARLASHLLNLSGEARERFDRCLQSSVKLTRQKQRAQPFSLFGSINLTGLCHLQGITFSGAFDIVEHTLANIYIANETHRLLLEIFFGENLRIVDIKYLELSIEDIDEKNSKRIKSLAEKLSEQRLKNRLSKTKKIGRNEQCPCGSGRKYKNCCQRS